VHTALLARSAAQVPVIGRTILRYGFGAAVPVCITLGQSLIAEVMRGAVLFPFVAGVFLVARTARLGPALVATAVSLPLADYFFLGERRTFLSVDAIVRLAVFTIASIAVAYFTDRLRKLERDARTVSQAREAFLSAATHEIRRR
jgi:K+-sensing histidine kinase KdpD